MASGILGRGTRLEQHDLSFGWGGTNATYLEHFYVTSISGPGATADQLDVTGLIDPGELTFTLLAYFGGTVQNKQTHLFTWFETLLDQHWRLVFPTPDIFTETVTFAYPVSKTISMTDVDASDKVVLPGMALSGAYLAAHSVVDTVDTSANTFTLTDDSGFPVNATGASQSAIFNEQFCSFHGAVTQAEYSAPVDGAITINVNVKILGDINWPGTGA